MNRGAIILFVVTTWCFALNAQTVNDHELARMLASDTTRQSAVDRIAASGQSKVPLLLLWAASPPRGIEKIGLRIGLADAFGRLKTTQAVPFLMKNIEIQRYPFEGPPWMHAASGIERHYPALAALIQIGPDSFEALLRYYEQPRGIGDRLFAIFAISRIAATMKDTPEDIRALLASAAGEANVERFWAEEGLKALDQTR
jgi:hypothetical protein